LTASTYRPNPFSKVDKGLGLRRGVVHQDIEAAELLPDGFEQGGNLFAPRKLCTDDDRRRAPQADVPIGCPEFIGLLRAVHHQRRASGRQLQGDRLADAPARPGH
jgi:hypothetical protein